LLFNLVKLFDERLARLLGFGNGVSARLQIARLAFGFRLKGGNILLEGLQRESRLPETLVTRLQRQQVG
jgi:hypothetical protein